MAKIAPIATADHLIAWVLLLATPHCLPDGHCVKYVIAGIFRERIRNLGILRELGLDVYGDGIREGNEVSDRDGKT